LAFFLPELSRFLESPRTEIAMIRAICLAVLCLLCMGAALALKPNAHVVPEAAAALPADTSPAPAGDDSTPFPVANASSKSDKLAMASVDGVEKVPVEAIKITPVDVEKQAQPTSAPKTSEVQPTSAPKTPEVRPTSAPKTAEVQPTSAPKTPEVVSWHWHVGSKITKRASP
jgi:hypothetical protein